ncbi:hypothetical protein L1987_18546 [Smallanthus sonchifolius]|uniref:Uncharacterized protein n=1 Tax=Smallanthus sonchifolius TaxID=185202 RepID=A0ACB9J280_9ASTR|nr:hypothetical protein L1987_18546 [Smallanthus sonchifolius]
MWQKRTAGEEEEDLLGDEEEEDQIDQEVHLDNVDGMEKVDQEGTFLDNGSNQENNGIIDKVRIEANTSRTSSVRPGFAVTRFHSPVRMSSIIDAKSAGRKCVSNLGNKGV